MMRIKIFFVIIALLFINDNSQAGSFCISPDGNDNNTGSIDSPYATIKKAHDAAQPGDTLYLRGGTYYPFQQTVFSKKGESGNYFVICSFPGEVPVIDGANVTEGNTNQGSTPTWKFKNAKYWKIIGPIIITNGRGAGIMIDSGDSFEFDQIESCYNGKRAARAAHGFMIWTGSNILFKNCDAHHNANHLWKSGEDQGSNQYQHGDGWRVFAGTSNIVFEGCRAWNNLDDNYDFYGADTPIKLINSWSAYAGRDDSLGTITGTPNRDMPLVDHRDIPALWGNGIKLGYFEDNVSHRIERCLSWGNNAAGFHMNLGPSYIINSVSYSNKAFGFDYLDGNKHEMHNSWEFSNNYANVDYAEVPPDLNLCSYNSWDNKINIFVDENDFVELDDCGMLDSRQPDGSLPVTSFLHLQEGSDLVDSGTDVGLSYLGNAPDIGAFESEYTATDLEGNNDESLPDDLKLIGYPNPFNSGTQIVYNLKESGFVNLRVFDVIGRIVIDLKNEYQTAGTHKVYWNARGLNDNEISSGIYFVRVFSKNTYQTYKLMFLK